MLERSLDAETKLSEGEKYHLFVKATRSLWPHLDEATANIDRNRKIQRYRRSKSKTHHICQHHRLHAKCRYNKCSRRSPNHERTVCLLGLQSCRRDRKIEWGFLKMLKICSYWYSGHLETEARNNTND